MAVIRDRPYVQFNFLVDLGDGNTDGPEAGFQEISGIGMEVTVAEYRNGNEKENSVRKVTGMNKSTDVTMKRGVIGSLNLYKWLDQIRNGNQNALRNVTIQLQNEDHTAVVQDVETAARPHHQAHQRAAQRQGDRRRDGRTGARLRTPRDAGLAPCRRSCCDRFFWRPPCGAIL